MCQKTDGEEPILFRYYIEQTASEIRHAVPFNDNCKHKLQSIKKLPNDLLDLPIEKLSPEKITQAIEPWTQPGSNSNRLYEIMAVIRSSTRKAFIDKAIPVDIGRMVKVRVNSFQPTLISDDTYAKVQQAFLTSPGALIVGLAVHLNAQPLDLLNVKYEDCYEENNTIHFSQSGKGQAVTLYDPDGIEIFQETLRQYQDRMSDPGVAEKNSDHLLFCTKYGQPYTDAHCTIIFDLLKENCASYELTINALRKYLIIRSL